MYYQIENTSLKEILNKIKVSDAYHLFLIVEQSILDKKAEQCLGLFSQITDLDKLGLTKEAKESLKDKDRKIIISYEQIVQILGRILSRYLSINGFFDNPEKISLFSVVVFNQTFWDGILKLDKNTDEFFEELGLKCSNINLLLTKSLYIKFQQLIQEKQDKEEINKLKLQKEQEISQQKEIALSLQGTIQDRKQPYIQNTGIFNQPQTNQQNQNQKEKPKANIKKMNFN